MANSLSLKFYLDKEIQTDSPLVSLNTPTRRGSVAKNDAANNLAIDLSLTTSLAQCDTAYTCSETQSPNETTRNSKFSMPTSISTRQRYAQLQSNRPSNDRVPMKRVVSLPEECEDHGLLDKPSQRVVSMPERLKPMSPNTSGSFSSLDISSVSFESNSLDLTKHSKARNFMCSHSDLPSTPSPPSSPESIVIIGSNSQVPRTLLRSKTAYKESYGNNGGWISWANSPPRPIPALHGPLSLPYARCPSGAEGTIIEGEDLANMIWGLSVEHTQSRSHASTNTGLQDQSAAPRLQKSKLISSSLPGGGAIDLSQLSVQRPNSRVAVTGQFFVPDVTNSNRRTQRTLQVGRTRMPETVAAGIPDWKRGLGLNWQDPIELPPPQHMLYRDDDRSALKASAPPFIPSNQGLSNFVVEPHLANFIQNNQDQIHGTISYLPTPPSSSSSLWSPHVATPSEMDIVSPQISLHGLPDDKQLLLSHLLSPRVVLKDYTQDYYWVADHLESIAKSSSSEDVPALLALKAAPPLDVVKLNNLDEGKGPSTNQDSNKATANLSPDMVLQVSNNVLQQCNNRNIPASPERRFRGILQQPRSIPLTRLIQRRLSSVAEEEVNVLVEESDALPSTKVTSAITTSGNKQSAVPTQSLVSNDRVLKRTPSSDAGKLELRTSREPATASDGQATKKAVVKLPVGDASLKVTPNAGKEKHTATLTGTVAKKKLRNRRNRSSSSTQGSRG